MRRGPMAFVMVAMPAACASGVTRKRDYRRIELDDDEEGLECRCVR